MFWSCDTPSTSFQASIETIENISGAELENKLSSLSAGKTGYTCSVSTWDMPGSEKQNTHVSVIHYFPEDLVEQAGVKTQTWTFVVTGPSEGEPKSFGEYENVVQIVRCSLPDVEGIEEIMTDRLLNINPAAGSTKLAGTDNQGSWHIHAYPEKSASIRDRESQDPDISNPMSGSCFNGVFCTLNFITIATVGEVVISITTRCIEWTYLAAYCGGGGGIPYYPPGDPGGPADPGGGGGSGPPGVPPGGDGSPVDDPCHIDTNDPNQPPQAQPVECLNDPCDWLAPPVGWMCGIGEALFPDLSGNDFIQDSDTIPDCVHEQEIPWKMDYCNSNEPSGSRLSRINEAIDNIDEREGICEDIAEKGRELLSDGHLRFFPRPNRGANIAGGRGLPNVEDGIVLLMDEWVDNWYNESVYVMDNGSPVEVNFEFALVHEIEHAMGKDHIHGSLWVTPNSMQCSGLN